MFYVFVDMMSHKINIIKSIVLIMAGAMLYACGKSKPETSARVLSVDLEQEVPAMGELFSRVEVVPLDNSDSCLLMQLTRVYPYKNQIYVVDRRRPVCYVFDKAGDFIRQIGRLGNGPGEYNQIEDCLVNEDRQEFLLMDTGGVWYVYDMDGNFLRKQFVPEGGACQSIVQTAEGRFAHWIYTMKDREAIRLFNDSGEYVKGYWHQLFHFNFMLKRPFYDYDGKAYFSTACFPSVYELSADTLREAYRWDYGDKGISPEVLEILAGEKESGENDGWEKATQFLYDGTLAFVQQKQYQTDRYYYVQLMKDQNGRPAFVNVFYDKRTDRSFVFEKVKEGFTVFPVAMTDEYLLSVLNYEDFQYMKDVLPAEEYAKLAALDEESNPCLLRMYFK